MAKENVPNLFRLTKSMPKGNWVMTAKFTIKYQTAQERPYLALYQDAKNYIEVLASAYFPYGMRPAPHVVLEARKISKGKVSSFAQPIWMGSFEGSFSEPIPQPIILRITKKGRSYYPAAMLEGAEKPKWVELEKLTVLRHKGTPAVGLYQAKKVGGESTMKVDWVKIETLE